MSTEVEFLSKYGTTIMAAVLGLGFGLFGKLLYDFIKSVRDNTFAIVRLTTHFEVFEKKVEEVPVIKKDVDFAHKKIRRIENHLKIKTEETP